jgi:hypothetical protein
MFTIRGRASERILPAGISAKRTTTLSCTNTSCGRRPIAMIAPQTWRRRGPINNLHDRLGTCAEGARREKPRTGRIGITFWHRPFRAAIRIHE